MGEYDGTDGGTEYELRKRLAEAEAKLAEAHKETEAANKTACDLEHSLRKATTDYADLQAKLAALDDACNGCLLVKGLKEKLAVADTKCDRCVFKGDGDILVSRDNRIAELEADKEKWHKEWLEARNRFIIAEAENERLRGN